MNKKQLAQLQTLRRKWAMQTATAKEVRRCMELESTARAESPR